MSRFAAHKRGRQLGVSRSLVLRLEDWRWVPSWATIEREEFGQVQCELFVSVIRSVAGGKNSCESGAVGKLGWSTTQSERAPDRCLRQGIRSDCHRRPGGDDAGRERAS